MAGRAVNFVFGANKQYTKKVKKVLDAYKNREQFKDIILEILKDYRLNNSELADMLEIESRGTVTKWLLGGSVSQNNLVKIADVFPTVPLQRLLLATANPEVWIRLMAKEKELSKNEQYKVFAELGFSTYEPAYRPEEYKKKLRDLNDNIRTE